MTTTSLPTPVTVTLESNLRQTLEAISAGTEECGRARDAVALLAVTKSVTPELALALVRLGQRDLGENRLPNLIAKQEHFARLDPESKLPVTWHYIGQIQRNKARKVLKLCRVLHSVDSLQLIGTLDRIALEEKRRVSIYLEVKLSSDPEKHGFQPDQLPEAIRLAGQASQLELRGLMTMASRPQGADQGARVQFDSMTRLAEQFEQDEALAPLFEHGQVQLSMGMSSDFQDAIAAGSHIVRIGTALFRGLAADGSQEQGAGA